MENGNGWLPIPKRFIQDKFRNSDPSTLNRIGLIDIDRSYAAGKRPRKYRLKAWVIDGYIEASHPAANEQGFVSIVTGKPIPPQPATTPPDPSNPPLVQAAIARLGVCYFDRPAVLEHLARLRAAHQQTPTTRNRFRYLNDWFIMDTIDKEAQPTDTPGIYRFAPTYTMQATGRIGTPLQSASRAMKAAAYGSLKGVYNYDLTSSQMALTMRELERHNIPCPWLTEYLNDPNKRPELARFVGVSIACWKEMLYAVLMTGHIPTNTKWGSPVTDTLAAELENPTEEAAALKRLRTVLRPLVRSLRSWHGIIETEAQASGTVTNILGLTPPSTRPRAWLPTCCRAWRRISSTP